MDVTSVWMQAAHATAEVLRRADRVGSGGVVAEEFAVALGADEEVAIQGLGLGRFGQPEIGARWGRPERSTARRGERR